MNSKWLKARQTKYWTYAGTYIVVILAVLAAVNFLANRYDKSYDSTANKQFSLSDQTLKVVKGLKRDLHATYFGETGSFPNARDVLERYAALSPKFHVRSEEHTSELQSLRHLVCRLLLETKNTNKIHT